MEVKEGKKSAAEFHKLAIAGLQKKIGSPSIGNVTGGTAGNYYSPELSPDFLELPQTKTEQWNYFRWFYEKHPYVGQAIDMHKELPLSQVRIGMPECRNEELGRKALRFCKKWAQKVNLLDFLKEVVWHYYTLGIAPTFAEDTSPEMPKEVTHEPSREIVDGQVLEKWTKYEDADQRAKKWLRKNYKGWTKLRVVPPENVRIETFDFTDRVLIEVVPDAKSREIVQRSDMGDLQAKEIVKSMDPVIVEAIRMGKNLPINTNPDEGSFMHIITRNGNSTNPYGSSILERCLRSLILQDKARQALAQITARHMTPYRLVSAENMDNVQTEELRAMVDLALQDPDYSIVTNFEVRWEEVGADQRVPDWSWLFDMVNQHLYAGLGVTEGLLTGESSYSGEQISLDVINKRYLFLRETLQNYVQNTLFKPMCEKMGFIEYDEDGDRVVITPTLSFSRMPVGRSQDTFDSLMNLYQKGSLPVDVILDHMNIDPKTAKEKLLEDLFTVNDSTFNEMVRSVYNDVAQKLAQGSNITEKVAEHLNLDYTKPKEEGMSRFASVQEKGYEQGFKEGFDFKSAMDDMKREIMNGVTDNLKGYLEEFFSRK